MKTFDAIIIGSGQGGNPLAKKLAKEGWKSILIEKDKVGGTCINTGCTPTKTMIASAKLAHMVKHSQEWGLQVNDYKINMPAIVDRKNKIVSEFRNASIKSLKSSDNLTVVSGEAFFIDRKKIEVILPGGGNEVISADKIFIDAGTHSFIPDIQGIEEINYYTSTSLLDLKEIPQHLLIIGGGYIGLEFGQLFNRLGSKVTILQSSGSLLSKEDEDVAEAIAGIFKAEGIEIFTNAKTKKVEKAADGIKATVTADGKEQIITCSHLLIATGRRANSESLNLNATGVETDERGFIKVNEKLETTVRGIYALGDIKGGPQFTHIAYNDHLIILDNLLSNKSASTLNRLVPYCMFTDPQLGRVGLTEREAREKGMNIKIAKLPMRKVARAIETGHTDGFMKAIINADDNTIAGVAIIGEEGGETMSVLQMAMMGKLTADQLRNMIFAHPLYAESINNLFMQLDK